MPSPRRPSRRSVSAVDRAYRDDTPVGVANTLSALRTRPAGGRCARKALGCRKSAKELAEGAGDAPLLTAWLLAWAGVAETGSVVPAYIWHRDPAIRTMVRTLRATPCGDSACEWCSQHQDPERELKRWFGLDGFRDRPSTEQGGSVQREIVCTHLAGTPLLAVMPTGAEKSLCYQLPAVMRHANTAELTVVISPLVALMVDQVDGMRRRGIDAVVTLNSLLSAPERTQALEQIVSGEAGIALIAPESLRSRPVRMALEQRLIGAWVIDEAHCVSKWGHDFRPDYRYVARFIRKRCVGEAPPTLLALTATAKHEVIDDIRRHFETVLRIELSVIDAGAKRENLDYQILPKSGGTDADAVWSVLKAARSETPDAAAIVYCITRRETETLAQALCERGLKAAAFHGNLRPDRKKTTQDGFMNGEVDVVVATKAFGMGVDKPKLFATMSGGAPDGLIDVEIEGLTARPKSSRKKARPAREKRLAGCELRFRRVTLPATDAVPGADPVAVHGVHIKEIAPPKDEEPVQWFLLTTVKVKTAQEAAEVVGFYLQRWRVEDFFRVLKSGCRVEFLLFRTADRLQRAIAINAVIAWRIMVMTLLGRQVPDCDPQLMFADQELGFLRDYALEHGLDAPKRLGDAVRLVAHLGGYRDRKHDPDPGNQIMWHGQTRLTSAALGHAIGFRAGQRHALRVEK